MHMSLSMWSGALAAASGAWKPLEGHVCNARLRSLAPFALTMGARISQPGRAAVVSPLRGALR